LAVVGFAVNRIWGGTLVTVMSWRCHGNMALVIGSRFVPLRGRSLGGGFGKDLIVLVLWRDEMVNLCRVPGAGTAFFWRCGYVCLGR
jgi:hypothetical protein